MAELAAAGIAVLRVYGDPGRQGSDHRVLVDRLWPRGVTKEVADLDEWARDLAPSGELRKWYGHAPDRFAEFARRYRAELAAPPLAATLERWRARARQDRLVLLTATRDLERSGAEVLRGVLQGDPGPQHRAPRGHGAP